MCLKAKHHPLIYPFFNWVGRIALYSHFRRVEFYGQYQEREGSVLLIANHFSWWDGFIMALLNDRIVKRRFYFMMQYEQLKKRPYFNLSGGFSVRKSHKSVVESLQYGASLLRNGQNLVLLFPQGEINSQHTSKIKFQKGVSRMAEWVGESPMQLLFAVSLVDYGSFRKPTLSIHFKLYEHASYEVELLEKCYQEFYDCCLSQQKKRIK